MDPIINIPEDVLNAAALISEYADREGFRGSTGEGKWCINGIGDVYPYEKEAQAELKLRIQAEDKIEEFQKAIHEGKKTILNQKTIRSTNGALRDFYARVLKVYNEQLITDATHFPLTACCAKRFPRKEPYPIYFNSGNNVVQCHHCGTQYKSML